MRSTLPTVKPGSPLDCATGAANSRSGDRRRLRDGIQQSLRDDVWHAVLQPERTHHRSVGEIHHGPSPVVEQVERRTRTGSDQDGLVGSQSTDRRFVGAPDEDRRGCVTVRVADRPGRFVAGQRLPRIAARPEYPAADRVWCDPIRTRAPAAGWRRVAAINRADARFSTGCQVSPTRTYSAPDSLTHHDLCAIQRASRPQQSCIPHAQQGDAGQRTSERQRCRPCARSGSFDGADIPAQQRALDAAHAEIGDR